MTKVGQFYALITKVGQISRNRLYKRCDWSLHFGAFSLLVNADNYPWGVGYKHFLKKKVSAVFVSPKKGD